LEYVEFNQRKRTYRVQDELDLFILGMGMEDTQRELREQYGRTRERGEAGLERSLGIGQEQLTQTLADIGKNPGDLFKRTVADRPGVIPGTAKQFPVLQDAAVALAPTAAQGTGDVAYEMAIDLQNQFDLDQAREMEEAGLGLDQIQRARAAAIRAGLEDNNYSEEEIEVIFDRLGLTEWLDVAAQAPYEEAANGGIIGLRGGGMPQMEMDYRGGGFIPVGAKERADDVPARLSKNEFVMTADAVRAAGGGSVNKGAQRMYDVMNKLEARA